jgi:hypothetical protein
VERRNVRKKKIILSCDLLTIEISDEEAEKLKYGFDGHKLVSVRSNHGARFVFTPSKNKGYNVKELDSDEFPEGVPMDKKYVEEIANMIDQL